MNARGLIGLLAPIGTSRRRVLKSIQYRIKSADTSNASSKPLSYDQWQKKVEPMLFTTTTEHNYNPLVSIVVPCYNTPEKYLQPLLDSVIGQLYVNWELCLADGSTDDDCRKRIQAAALRDERIRYIPIKDNLGIVGNTNKAIEAAKGEFVGFLDHDDVLSKHALNEVVALLNIDESLDLIYSDEDKLSDNGQERLPHFFKPDWSPELLLGVNYITHFTVARNSIVQKIGGLRAGFDGAQDYDFLLRFTELTNKIARIPKILYHWRLADGSTAKGVGEKNYADTAGQRALADAVARRGIAAEVIEIPERPTNYRLRYAVPSNQPKVSIIIPFKDKVSYLEKCIPSILEKTTYKNYEILLVSNNSVEEETFAYLASLKDEKHCKVLEWNEPFNYSAVNNFGRKNAGGEFLIFLNNDTEILTPSWIDELIGVASQKEAGAVGPLLRYPDRRIQHAGVVLGMGGMAGHVFRLLQPEQWTDFGMPCWPRNYLAVTGACLVVDAKKFDEVGGFDEQLTIGGNDVALGITLHERGYRNIYWPFVEIIHYENVSVGPYAKSVPIGDYNRSLTYYDEYLKEGDPYFNPNLDLMNEQIAIRSLR